MESATKDIDGRNLTSMKASDIWIDAICINQNDNFEKASQVRLMGRIYEHAMGVTWLGPGSDNSASHEYSL